MAGAEAGIPQGELQVRLCSAAATAAAAAAVHCCCALLPPPSTARLSWRVGVLFGWLCVGASEQGAVQNLQQLCAILGPIAWGNLYDRLSKNGARGGYKRRENGNRLPPRFWI